MIRMMLHVRTNSLYYPAHKNMWLKVRMRDMSYVHTCNIYYWYTLYIKIVPKLSLTMCQIYTTFFILKCTCNTYFEMD